MAEHRSERAAPREWDRPRLRSWARRLGPLLGLALPGIVAVAVMAVVLTISLRDAGIEQERDEAKLEAALAGSIVVAPHITPGLLDGDPAALAEMDAAVRKHVLGGPIDRVKLWSEDGVVVYSDEPSLIGDRFEIEPEDREVLTSGRATADLSELKDPENRFERDLAPVIEVYTRVRGPDGEPMLFEAYHEFDSLAASDRALLMTVLPALGGGLLLLGLGSLAAATWFSRYVRRRDEQRAALLASALDASNRERKRIAADLHDGVVQDLTAALLTVESARPWSGAGQDGAVPAPTRREVAEAIRQSLAALRATLIDVYPADVDERGLAAALGDLVQRASANGLEARLDVPADLGAPTHAAGLLYRVAQESLRNTIAHAGARHVLVSAGNGNGGLWLEVRDDGKGFDTGDAVPDGHFGLRVVRDMVADAGGRLSVQSARGKGSVVRAELPGRG